VAPVGQETFGWKRSKLLGAGIDESRRILGGLGQHRSESGLVGHRGQRDPIGPQQVGDLMGDRPSWRGCGIAPPIGRQVGNQRVQVVAFRP
jgi:hypothetical protein